MPPRVDPRWIRNKSDRQAIREGCYFDETDPADICAFIETHCIQSQDRWADKPIILMEWERDFLYRLFGWKRKDGRRRFETAYVEIGKKNGKSTLLAALELALMLIDGQSAPEIRICACDRGQASIIFDESARMVRNSPALARRLKVIDYRKRITWKEGNGVIIANSADAPNKDGLNPSAIIFDELHRQPDYSLWDIFKYASAARSEPLKVSLTTAGEAEAGPWFDQRDLSEKVNAGIIPITTHLGIVYRCDPADDLDDPEVWRKANPALGITIDLARFRQEYEAAKANPREFALFKRLRFNIVSNSDTVFIPIEVWDKCDGATNLRDKNGHAAYLGLDLSTTTDLTALAALIADPDPDRGGYDLHSRFWLPKDNIIEAEQRDRVPYQAWSEAGYISLTTGATVDYAAIRRAINALAGREWSDAEQRFKESTDPKATRLDIKRISIDPWNAAQLAQELAEEDGFNVVFVRQGYASLTGPTKELERLVRGQAIRHGGHPLMRWCMSNAIALSDDSGNVKLSKRKSRQKIDGAAALVNATAGTQTAEETGSVYDTRDMILI